MSVAKLTLSVSPVLIKKGKRIAQKRNNSLSALISDFLENLEEPPDKAKSNYELSPEIKEMCGAYRLPEGKTEDDLKFEYLFNKHVLHD
ncbi:MAG: DUF6364 family protein [Fibromonadaceae bacterium]|jgi:hypothetical protein|nr:DUF6364 family protein [Fibromonadaceae bacterium]